MTLILEVRVIAHFVKQYKKKTRTDVSPKLRALGKREVEKAKRTLSNQQSTRLEIESFGNGNDLSETLTRAKFEELDLDLFRPTMKPVEQFLKDTGIRKDGADEVVLVGGPTRIPKVQQRSSRRSPRREPTPIRLSPMVPPSKVASSLVRKTLPMLFLSMSDRFLLVSRPPVV